MSKWLICSTHLHNSKRLFKCFIAVWSIINDQPTFAFILVKQLNTFLYLQALPDSHLNLPVKYTDVSIRLCWRWIFILFNLLDSITVDDCIPCTILRKKSRYIFVFWHLTAGKYLKHRILAGYLNSCIGSFRNKNWINS